MDSADVKPHRIDVVMDKEGPRLQLVCPGEGHCNAFFACAECEGAGTVEDDEGTDYNCSECEGTGASGDICGLMDWFDGGTWDELYVGGEVVMSSLGLPAEITITHWHTDDPPEWEFVVPPERELSEHDALVVLNRLRANVVATQRAGWSDVIYPLVAVLNAAGFEPVTPTDLQKREHRVAYNGAGRYPRVDGNVPCVCPRGPGSSNGCAHHGNL